MSFKDVLQIVLNIRPTPPNKDFANQMIRDVDPGDVGKE
jgi:hypothetical protein